MSLVTNLKLYEFHRWLRDPANPFKPTNQEELADLIMTNRAHLSQVLSGKRRGGHTWRRLVKVLPEEGLSLLRQSSAWNNFAEAALVQRRKDEDFAKRFGPKSSALNAQKLETVNQ